MKRTQIQLPDSLHREATRVAEDKEISLAELVRRGLEYMIAVSPAGDREGAVWRMPEPVDLGSTDPFAAESWRSDLHMTDKLAAEEREDYDTKDHDRP